MSDISTYSKYSEVFCGDKIDKAKWREEALKCALDIRKFEIELYWKRAAYFWTLIAASFAGYFALQNVEPYKRNIGSIFIITCIGLILSFAWHLVNRGSKYWQENWERHVDILAEEVMGPLYRTTLSYSTWDIIYPRSGFPFSVSRIHQVISLYVTILWLGLAIQAFPFSAQIRPNREMAYWMVAGYTGLFLILVLWSGWPRRRKKPRNVSFDLAPFGEDLDPDKSSVICEKAKDESKNIKHTKE